MVPKESVFAGWLLKLFVGALAALLSFRYGAGIYAWHLSEQLEKPKYTVIKRLSDGVELRRYDPYLIAETTVEEGLGFREPTRSGFRTCAGYIFGKNKSRKITKRNSIKRFGAAADGNNKGRDGNNEKMAMTAPVRVSGQAPTDGENEKMAMTAPVRVFGSANKKRTKKTKVSFVIGSNYTLESAPKPVDRNVTIREVPMHILAVRKFSGPPPKDDKVQRERQRVEQALTTVNLKPSDDDETLLYGYHDPFLTPNFLRRNEVGVYVDNNQAISNL